MKSIYKSDRRRIKHIGSKRFGIQYLLKGIYTHNGMPYFHTQIKNASQVPFDIDFIRWKHLNKKPTFAPDFNREQKKILSKKNKDSIFFLKTAQSQNGINTCICQLRNFPDEKSFVFKVLHNPYL